MFLNTTAEHLVMPHPIVHKHDGKKPEDEAGPYDPEHDSKTPEREASYMIQNITSEHLIMTHPY